ncbi:MAG: ketopantoate reductase C-terminal domain-containing protein, partial [Polyangiaceae bacterium]
LQNGVGNSDVLRTHLPGHPVLAGIVSFNVVGGRPGVFRQGTSGPLIIERSSSPIALQLCDALRRSGIGVVTPREIARHQWAKLLMNLGNAVSALSGAPTREMILTPGYRKILASIIGEALRVLSAAGIRPAKLRGVPPALLVTLLGLPTPLVRVFARAQLRVNADARSSMWEDLERKRATEVDYLNGEIVRVAARAGVEARVNGAIVALVHEVEARGQGSPNLSPEALSAALTAAGAPS